MKLIARTTNETLILLFPEQNRCKTIVPSVEYSLIIDHTKLLFIVHHKSELWEQFLSVRQSLPNPTGSNSWINGIIYYFIEVFKTRYFFFFQLKWQRYMFLSYEGVIASMLVVDMHEWSKIISLDYFLLSQSTLWLDSDRNLHHGLVPSDLIFLILWQYCR